MRADQHKTGRGPITPCLSALILLALLSGCGFADYGAWERSLLIPAQAPQAPGYTCPPGYHIIPCPTCRRPLYRTERRCRRGDDCDYVRIPYREEQNPCGFCQGSPYMCEPDGAERGGKNEAGKQ